MKLLLDIFHFINGLRDGNEQRSSKKKIHLKLDCAFEVCIGSCLVGRGEVQSQLTKSIETKSEQLLFSL